MIQIARGALAMGLIFLGSAGSLASRHGEESPNHGPAAQRSTSTDAPVPSQPPAASTRSPAPANGNSGPSPEVPPSGPRIAALLDPDKGQRARADYWETLASMCRSLQGDPGGAASMLASVGFEGVDGIVLCVINDIGTAGEALASGSFEQLGADEVVLVVPSGLDRAAGDHALALMRKKGTRYRLVRYTAIGNDRFEARARIATGNGTDILMVCNHHGQAGVYRSTCGFLGRGSFERDAAADSNDEIELLRVTACGPAASVSLGDVALLGRSLRVELVLEEFVLERTGHLCSRKEPGRRRRFRIDYELDGNRFRRVTPVSPEVTEVLKRY